MKKPPLLATVLTFIALAVLCGLGTWQIQRLQQKEQMIAALAAAYDTGSLPALSQEDIGDLAGGAMIFARGAVQGRYMNEHSFAVGPRTWKGQAGWHVVTPLALGTGGILLVNRGWVSQDKKEASQRPESLITGFTTVTGLLRHPARPKPFVPDNDPAAGQWLTIDPSAAAKAFNLDSVLPLVMYAESETGIDSSSSGLVYEALKPNLANNHKAYIAFWFTMAGVLLIFYYLRFLKKDV